MVELLQTSLGSAQSTTIEYSCRVNLDLYDGPECASLATQAAAGRQLRVLSVPPDQKTVEACLCEDDYRCWLSGHDLEKLEYAVMPYRAIALSDAEIKERLPGAIAFAQEAMQQINYYLWGGTVGPNYDCSGLMQAAFCSVGIWLPRDSYQQEAFVQEIPIVELQPGDLIFFGSAEKVNHVGLYLGEGKYIHSSGKYMGRNGIGIDLLSEQGDAISQAYYQQLLGAGRVVASYLPGDGNW
ncbi:MAG: C40 family peptidase [Hormoscilla sp. SP5CHS1]|nr:C40 family peptidase [Hormoscilla sp. SP12CHS1]MBC6455576.1 C40 family peptidase [Hormoscilla sp. SP5CHS1]